MTITRDVINDLLPVYVAGEASSDTVTLVEEFVRQDPAVAQTVDAMRAGALLELPANLHPTKEKEALNVTKRLLRWRGILMGLAVFLTLLPLSLRFDNGRITSTFLQGASPAAAAVVCLAAIACWGGFFYVRRRLGSTGI